MEKFLARKPRLQHDTPGWVLDPEFFITICCNPRRRNQLCNTRVARLIVEAFRFYRKKRFCQIELLVLMPDHLHAIIKVPDSVNLGSWISALKHWITRKSTVRFQGNFFDHRLRSSASASQKWNYVSMNPVRAGFVERPEDWPYRFTTRDFERMLH